MIETQRGLGRMKAVVLIAALTAVTPALAQQKQAPPPKAGVAPPATPAKPPAAPQANAQPPAQPNAAPSVPLTWTSRCSSDSRKATLLCEIDQSMFITQTGQLVAVLTIKIPPDTREPVMMVQLPVGLFLPEGVKIQVDDKKFPPLSIQTCDLKGCYAATPVAADMLAAMKTAQHFNVIFQNLNKEDVTLTFSLTGFAEALDRVN